MCPLSSRQTKNKRICKMNRFFHLPLLRGRGRFSSHSGCADSSLVRGSLGGDTDTAWWRRDRGVSP